MSRRLKLIVAYDGSQFTGWQSQSHRNTIQDHIERAFERIGGKPVRVLGAGRTDAGVHALAQCAHADLTDEDRKSTRLNSSHGSISYAVFCLKKKNTPVNTRHYQI